MLCLLIAAGICIALQVFSDNYVSERVIAVPSDGQWMIFIR